MNLDEWLTGNWEWLTIAPSKVVEKNIVASLTKVGDLLIDSSIVWRLARFNDQTIRIMFITLIDKLDFSNWIPCWNVVKWFIPSSRYDDNEYVDYPGLLWYVMYWYPTQIFDDYVIKLESEKRIMEWLE